jgi:hypothetical protein
MRGLFGGFVDDAYYIYKHAEVGVRTRGAYVALPVHTRLTEYHASDGDGSRPPSYAAAAALYLVYP